jgi:hypothetical protein
MYVMYAMYAMYVMYAIYKSSIYLEKIQYKVSSMMVIIYYFHLFMKLEIRN